MPHRALFLLALLPAPVSALTLDIPGAPVLVAEELADPAAYALPVGPYAGGTLPVRVTEGAVRRQAWRIRAAGVDPLQVIAPLRDQLRAQGFAVLLDCDTAICGGFDFRFATEVMPPPAMHVDLGDFRFLAAERSDGTPERVGILVSRSAAQVFVQVIHAAPPGAAPALAQPDAAPLQPADAPPPASVPGDFGYTLEAEGRVVLADLAFATGSAQLAEGEFTSLAALAAYLRADAGRRVALVGHTDAEGPLDANIRLSQRRAASVVERLATAHDVPRAQMTAEGMGWLAPLATNLTPEGREANRRVEAVLLPSG